MKIIESIDELKEGDYVISEVFTFSQKYLMDERYKEFNFTKKGIITKLGNTFFNTYIKDDNGDEVVLASDPGSSGVVTIRIL